MYVCVYSGGQTIFQFIKCETCCCFMTGAHASNTCVSTNLSVLHVKYLCSQVELCRVRLVAISHSRAASKEVCAQLRTNIIIDYFSTAYNCLLQSFLTRSQSYNKTCCKHCRVCYVPQRAFVACSGLGQCFGHRQDSNCKPAGT